jgi:threonine synthase
MNRMMNPPGQSGLTHLLCPECNRHFVSDSIQTICQHCQSPLLAQYDLATLRKNFDSSVVKKRPRGLWRWAELLPVRDRSKRITLGEGDTPVLPTTRLAETLGLHHLYVKDESTNPTGTFKARGMAVAVSRAIELGLDAFVIPTAGNAGSALANYAARGHCSAHIFMPEDAPLINQYEVRMAGADLHLVNGLITDAARAAQKQATLKTDKPSNQEKSHWFNISTFKEPYRLEGKKTMGFELTEYFDWILPDVIIYPTGGGTGLVGIWKAFNELLTLGLIQEIRTRMVCVQAAGCAPIVQAFQSGTTHTQIWQDAHTIASGLRVPIVFADRLILRALKESNGLAISVTDDEIIAAQKLLANTEGIWAALEGAATLAALKKLVSRGWIKSQARVVLLNTGSGMKTI